MAVPTLRTLLVPERTGSRLISFPSIRKFRLTLDGTSTTIRRTGVLGGQMVERLPARAIRVFAVLESYGDGENSDVLDSLLPFFEPVVAEFGGQSFDPEKCASRIRSEYHWNLTADVIEELIPRFRAKGWLEPSTWQGDKQLFKVANFSSERPTNQARATETLAKLVAEFRQFVEALSPLTGVSLSDDALADGLVEWLVTEDAYVEDALRDHATTSLQDPDDNISKRDNLERAALSSEMRYLCARFVKYLFGESSPLVADLCKIASIGLLTEVVRDFNTPTSRISRTDVTVYLDAPVALDLLGVSGKAAADNVRALVTQLQSIGAVVRIFRTSVDELTYALKAVLQLPAPARFGPTADALRRNETSELFVKQVIRAPAPILREYSVQIDERKLEQYPNLHQHFSEERYEELFNRIDWHSTIPPREHDATIATQIMRMRAGITSGDLFATRFVLVTRNARLAYNCRRICLDQDQMRAHVLGPAIHQRQLATAIWLRTGLQGQNEEIPRRYLLSACERVLELKPTVVTQVRLLANSLTEEKAQQLELLLTLDRSTQVLMDKTLGVSTVITPSNIELLVDDMKRGLVSDMQRATAENIKAAEAVASSKVLAEASARRGAEERATQADRLLSEAHEEDVRIVGQLLGEVNKDLKLIRKAVIGFASVVILLVAIGPMIAEFIHGWHKFVPLVIVALITFVLARLQILDRPTGLPALLKKIGEQRLSALASQRALSAKLARFDYRFVDSRFVYSEKAPLEDEGVFGDLLTPLDRPTIDISQSERKQG